MYLFINELDSDCAFNCRHWLRRKLIVPTLKYSSSPNGDVGCRSPVGFLQQTKTFFVCIDTLHEYINALRREMNTKW